LNTSTVFSVIFLGTDRRKNSLFVVGQKSPFLLVIFARMQSFFAHPALTEVLFAIGKADLVFLLTK
jgi:hypothetical protein